MPPDAPPQDWDISWEGRGATTPLQPPKNSQWFVKMVQQHVWGTQGALFLFSPASEVFLGVSQSQQGLEDEAHRTLLTFSRG